MLSFGPVRNSHSSYVKKFFIFNRTIDPALKPRAIRLNASKGDMIKNFFCCLGKTRQLRICSPLTSKFEHARPKMSIFLPHKSTIPDQKSSFCMRFGFDMESHLLTCTSTILQHKKALRHNRSCYRSSVSDVRKKRKKIIWFSCAKRMGLMAEATMSASTALEYTCTERETPQYAR